MIQYSRRTFLGLSASLLAAGPALASEPYKIPRHHVARTVRIKAGLAPGEIHVDPGQFALYLTLENGQAIRYPVGIAREGRYISGTFRLAHVREWPSWTPTANMIRREPHIYAKHAAGMPGGPDNPLGARALYLHRGSRDSLLRIHGTPRPDLVGRRVSNGCVRMINEHVIDLVERVQTGARVVLH